MFAEMEEFDFAETEEFDPPSQFFGFGNPAEEAGDVNFAREEFGRSTEDGLHFPLPFSKARGVGRLIGLLKSSGK